MMGSCPSGPSSPPALRRSARVVKDDAERHARARTDCTDAVSHDDTVGAAAARDGTLAGREDDARSLLDRERMPARLRARPLLDEQEFAAAVIDVASAQGEDHLQRERQVAIEILMQAVVATRGVRQRQRRRPRLASRLALLQEFVERGWVL